VRQWERNSGTKTEKWKDAEERILAYIPERDVDAARRAERESGMPSYTTIQVPYTYAVVMAAHTYLTSVFMGRDPVFQVSGRHGEPQMSVQAMEALLAYQLLVGRMLPYLYTWLYDSLKYGIGIIGIYWDNRIENVTTIQEQPILDMFGQPTGGSEKIQTTTPFRSYSGNRIYCIQPQSFIWDVRVPMKEFMHGEYCGEKKKLQWNEIVRREKAGTLMNVEHIKGGQAYSNFNTSEGSGQLERPEIFSNSNTGYEAQTGTKHPWMVGVIQLVVEIIPKEDMWKLSNSDFPEKWVFTCTDDFSILLGASPLGAYHCQYPYSVIPLEPEGYGLVPRGMPETLTPIQNTLDWLINSHFFNVRAALNNRYIVDPSRVVMKDLLDPKPGGIVRVKASAYGQDVKQSMSQFPITDVTQHHIADFQNMLGVGERVIGVNDQIMGMLNNGGRKTATEVRTSTGFGVNRLKTICEFASATGWDPLSMMMVQNSQQYYDMALKLKIVGDLSQTAGQNFLTVTPDAIAGFYDFIPIDGSLPIDRYQQVGLWKELFQTVLTIPQIGLQYDLARIFQWVAQLAGLKNISQFKIQVAPDQLLQMQAQAGNVIPLGGPPGKGKTTSALAGGPQGPQATGGMNGSR
jgi:hypothetical protein